MIDQYKLVPVEPTPEMLKAADCMIDCDPIWMARTYRAMLAAAPEAPKPAAAVSVKPVAWVDVADAEHGPYAFHGIEKLPAGKHHLFAAPPAPSNGRTT